VQKKFAGYYSRGKRTMALGNYADAVEYFKKSVKDYPLKSYRYIGVCYLHQKQFKEALKYIVKAFKMDKKSPVSTFYLANCCDNMGKIIDAKYYYKKYLKMKYSNPKLNSYANRRLKELKKKKRKENWSGELLRVMDAILKEIK
jgi:tetratricopeptide (TPR) repeat protein